MAHQSSSPPFADLVANYTPKFSTLTEVFRETHESRGIDIQTIRRLLLVGDVENLVEATCMLLDRRSEIAQIDPTLIPPVPKTLGQGGTLGPSDVHVPFVAASPNSIVPGYAETEELTAKYLGINHGYRTQSLDYPGLFFSICCLEQIDLLDFFRIMRSRMDWTSQTFRQAWLDSEFRHYKQWVVNNLVHVPPSHYHFYFFAKMFELLFRPVVDPITGAKTYGDVLTSWLTPQVCQVGESGTEFEWTFDIFGPFDASTTQEYINNLLVRLVDSAFYSSNFTALYTLLSQPAIPDLMAHPRGYHQSPRAISQSYLPYVEPNFNKLNLSKHIVETIFSSRTLLNYFHYKDSQQQISFYTSLAKNAHFETQAQIIELDSQRSTHIKYVETLKETVVTKLSTTTPRAVELLHQLSTLYVKLAQINQTDTNITENNATIDAKSQEAQDIPLEIITLHEELSDIKSINQFFQEDYEDSMYEIKRITLSIEQIKLSTETNIDRYSALARSWTLRYNSLWSYITSFIELFGLDFTLTQDLFALSAYAGLTNDYQLALLLCRHGFQFVVPNPNTTEVDELFEPLTFSDDMVKEYFEKVTQATAAGTPLPTLLSPQNVMWDYHHSIHRRQIICSFKYISLNKHASALFTREQNINFLTLRLLEANLTTEIDLLLKHVQSAKLTIPKQPTEKEDLADKEEKEEKKKAKQGKKGEKKDMASMMQKMMSGGAEGPEAAGIPGASGKVKTPVGALDDDDDDDFFGTGALRSPVVEQVTLSEIRTPENTLGKGFQPSTTRKIVSINDLQMGGNYISYICLCHTVRPATLSYLLSKKAKLYSNSRRDGPSSNAFLQCCIAPIADPKSRIQMLDILFQFVEAAAASPTPYNPLLTFPEFLEVINHHLIKMHQPLGTSNLLAPEHHMFPVHNQHNIYYEDRSELFLITRRLISPAFDEKGPKLLANRGVQQPTVFLTNTLQAIRFEFLSNTFDLSVYDPHNHQSFIHHHKMHVMLSDHLQNQEELASQAEGEDYLPQKFNLKKYQDFPYHKHPASFTNRTLSVDNGFHGYFGFLDQLDPFQRDFTSTKALSNKTRQDAVYMKANPQKNTFHAGFYKDLCVLVTQCVFGQPEHRAQIGAPGGQQIILPLLRFVLSCRCIPLIQWFLNHGFRATSREIEFLFFTQTQATFLQDINFEEFFSSHINRTGMVKGFTAALQWKRDYTAQGCPKDALDIAHDERVAALALKVATEKAVVDAQAAAEKAALKEIQAFNAQNLKDVDTIDGDEDILPPSPTKAKVIEQDDLLNEMFNSHSTDASTSLVESPTPNDATKSTTSTPEKKGSKPVAKKASAKKAGAANPMAGLFGKIGANTPGFPGTSGKSVEELQAENEKNAAIVADLQTKKELEDPMLQNLLPLTQDDLNQLAKPFSTHLSSGFYPLLKKTTQDIFLRDYIDPAIHTLGVEHSYLGHQHVSQLHFEIDCDYYFTSSHAKSAQGLIDFSRGITFSDAQVRYPSFVEQVQDIAGTASRYGVPGAVQYDFIYLFKDPAPPPPKKAASKTRGQSISIQTEEEYNLIGDYQNTFVIECLRLWRIFQSYFHQIRSPLYSPTIQCLLLLARSCSDFDDTGRVVMAESAWITGSSLAGYVVSLSRSDPFMDKDFVGPMSAAFSFFLSHTEYTTIYRYHKLLKLFTSYLLPDREAFIQHKPQLARGYQWSLFLASNLSLLDRMGNRSSELQQQLIQAQQMQMMLASQGGKMPFGMMPPGMGMPDPQQIQRELNEIKIQSISPITSAYQYLGYFPQWALKNITTNPLITGLFEDKLLSCELYSFYRTANRESDFAANSYALGADKAVINTSNDSIIHPKYGCPFQVISISIGNEKGGQTVISLQHSLQPIHYVATSMYSIFSQIERITDVKNALQYEFQSRAQKCRSEKDMQKLQSEMAQHMQSIEVQEQLSAKQYIHKSEINKMAAIIDCPFKEEEIFAYVQQIGLTDASQIVGMDDKGNPIDSQGKVVVQPGQRGDDEDAQLVLKQVMQSKRVVGKGFFSSIFGSSSALILGGVAVAASAAYYAYQFWNGSRHHHEEEDITTDVALVESPTPSLPSVAPPVQPKPAQPAFNEGPFKLKF